MVESAVIKVPPLLSATLTGNNARNLLIVLRMLKESQDGGGRHHGRIQDCGVGGAATTPVGGTHAV